MEEIKLGTKIRILPYGEQEPYMRQGDTATICCPVFESVESEIADRKGYYWADFNRCSNSEVYDKGIWCVGTLGRDFEILEENV